MLRRLSILLVLLTVVGGCGPSPQQKYDDAVRELERAQARLDNLMPAYTAAKQTAANAVCRDLAGTTLEESESAALAGLGNVLNQTAPAPTDESKKGGDAKKVASGRKGDELDKTIDNLIAGEKDAQEKATALAAPMAKVKEIMTKINTPGTPEAKKLQEKLADMPEVKAYERQQKRIEQAQHEVDEAKKDLPDGGSAKSESK